MSTKTGEVAYDLGHTQDTINSMHDSSAIDNADAPQADTTGIIRTMPMSPLAASATCVNLILATGPFTYPYGYTALGPVISAPLLFLVAILAYITATYLFEAISISQALQRMERAVEADELD